MRYRLHTDKGLLHFRRLLPNTLRLDGPYKYSATSLPETAAALLIRYGRKPTITTTQDRRYENNSNYIGSTWYCEKLGPTGWEPVLIPHFRKDNGG